jgi:hypothetical protein
VRNDMLQSHLQEKETIDLSQKTQIMEKGHPWCQNGLIFFQDSLLCTKNLFFKFKRSIVKSTLVIGILKLVKTH